MGAGGGGEAAVDVGAGEVAAGGLAAGEPGDVGIVPSGQAIAPATAAPPLISSPMLAPVTSPTAANKP